MWGAGTQGAMFLNTDAGAEAIQTVVDLSPRKPGRFVPVSAQQVISPDGLKSAGVDVVLVMNPVYESEIREMLGAMGLDPQVESV